MTLIIRSSTLLDILTTSLQKMEDEGFYGTHDAGLLQTLLGRLRMHKTRICLLDATEDPMTPLDAKAKALALGAANSGRPMILPPIPEELHLTGARLASMTQAIAYGTIKQLGTNLVRTRTQKMIRSVKLYAKSVSGIVPNEATIWRGIRNKDFSRQIRIFLWKVAHDAYKVGQYWDRPSMDQNLRVRALCSVDNCTDSLEHILGGCTSPGQQIIWSLADDIWKKKTGDHLGPQSPASVIGCTFQRVKSTCSTKSAGLARLLRILVVESAYLVWVLRCERTIQKENSPFSSKEVSGRWFKVIRDRAALDMKVTTPKSGKKARLEAIIKETWEDTGFVGSSKSSLEGGQSGVLVGSGLVTAGVG